MKVISVMKLMKIDCWVRKRKKCKKLVTTIKSRVDDINQECDEKSWICARIHCCDGTHLFDKRTSTLPLNEINEKKIAAVIKRQIDMKKTGNQAGAELVKSIYWGWLLVKKLC